MTDFARPTTPGDALRDYAASLKALVALRERKLAEDLAAVDVLREQVWNLEADADKYDRYQPTGGGQVNDRD